MNRSNESWASLAVLALHILGLAVLLLLPLLVSDYWIYFIYQMVAASYLALSFSLAYSYSKILSFVQGLFFAIGAYAAIYLATAAPWGLPLVLLAAAAGAAIAGAIIGAMLVRMDNHGATIATVILASAAYFAGNAMSAVTGGEDGLRIASSSIGLAAWQLKVGGNLGMYYVAAMPMIAMLVAMWAMQRTALWKLMRAIAMNEIRAQQLGFNVRLRRFVVFTLSAAIAGLGGAFHALLMGHITTSVLDIALSVNAILWAVVGGVGTAFGPLIGVLLIYPVTEAVAKVFTYVQILIGLLLVIVAIAFPRGIVGTLRELGERGGAEATRPPARPATSAGTMAAIRPEDGSGPRG